MATLYVLYGSATGNAEGIAKDLADKRPLPAGFDFVVCAPMEKFKKVSEPWLTPPTTSGHTKHGVLMVASTTGNGDAPENASRFVRYLKRKTTVESKPYGNLAFAVLALGDTNYDQFCATGRLIDKQMNALGATRAKPVACADEATGLEDVVEPWTATAFDAIAKACSGGDVAATDDAAVKKQAEEEKTEADAPSAPNAATATATPVEEAAKPADVVNAEATTPAPVVAVAATPPPEKSDSPLFILYGSATGNAEEIAKDLASTYELISKNPDAKCFFPSVICCEADQYKKKCQSYWDQDPPAGSKHGVIIVASTTGNGDAPDNIGRFVRYLKRKTTVDIQPFRNCAYAVLALGDTNYDQFCETGRVVDKFLAVLGGTRARSVACADEGTGLEDVVDPWVNSIFMTITNACKGIETNGATNAPSKVATKASTPKINKEMEEEKKTESADLPSPTITAAKEEDKTALGVRIVQSLLSLPPSGTIPSVEESCLPALLSCRLSCECVEGGTDPAVQDLCIDDDASVSSTDSADMAYTYRRPYEASILKARYLTLTTTAAASSIAEKFCPSGGIQSDDDILACHNILDNQFPLGAKSTAEAEDAECALNGKRVIEMSLSIPNDKSLKYQPGDSIGLAIPNTADCVTFVLDMLKLNHDMDPSQSILLDKEKTTTVDDACRFQFDLSSPVKNQRLLLNLSRWAKDPQEIKGLRYLASKDGCNLFQEYVINQRRSIVGLLRDFPSCQAMTLENLLSLLPALPTRYYSVASSPLGNNTEGPSLTVAFSVVDYITSPMTVFGKEEGNCRIHGIATRQLEALCSPFLSGTKQEVTTPHLRIFPKPTDDFHLPVEKSTPLILIGPGTGIAPFMGFLAHRQALAKQMSPTEGKESEDMGPVDVYFGCRHEAHDWLYRSEMKQYEADGTITRLFTVFSRDGQPNRYVQDIMRNDSNASSRIVDLILNKKAAVYICGDGNHMAKDVQTAIAELLGQELGGSEEGTKAIAEMKTAGRLLLDIWS